MADPKEEAEGREAATIHLLPDHLLARCFLKVPKRFRRSVLPQTCKRWRKVASSASELWIHRDVALQGKPWEEDSEPNQNWVRLIQWHSQKAQAINSLAVKASGSGLPCLPALLACLGPDSLVNLEISLKDSAWSLHHRALLSLHCAALAAISCFRHLKKLVLRNWPGGINSIQADAIGSLTALEHLEINLHKELSWDPRRSWEDDGFFSDTEDEESDQEDEEFVGGLTRRFSKELGKLTRLHTLVLRGGWPNVPSLPLLTRLQRLEFCGESMFGLSPGITDLRELTTLTILNRGGSRNASVIRNLTGLTGLKSLRIMDRAFPSAISTLTGLTSLEMRIGRVPPDRIEEDFRLMLLRLHRLQRLHLEVMHMEMLPEALVQLDHLTELHLERCNLPGLPRGRYLQSLQVLSLAGNAMERLPAALATAAKLETVDVSEMELQLGRAGKKLLFEMPALKLVRAFAAPHVDAGAPLRLADELYRVNKMRQNQTGSCVPLEIQVSRNDSSSSSDDEGSQAFSAEDQGSDSDSDADSSFSNF